MNLIKRLYCRHADWDFVRNIYGDEINYAGGARSLWSCAECGKLFRDYQTFPLESLAIGYEQGDFVPLDIKISRCALVFSPEELQIKFVLSLVYLVAACGLAFLGSVFTAPFLFALSCFKYRQFRRAGNLKILEK